MDDDGAKVRRGDMSDDWEPAGKEWGMERSEEQVALCQEGLSRGIM